MNSKKIMTVMMLCLAVIISAADAQQATITVGILPFKDSKGRAADEAVTSELSAVFGSYRFIRLVERAQLAEMLKEVQLGMTGLVDENSAVKAGKLRGLEVMVFGAVSPAGVSARAVHTETGRVVATASVTSTAEVKALGDKLAFDMETYLARENIKRMRNDSTVIRAEFWVEKKGGGRLVAGQANRLKIGDSVSFNFRANRDGYLTIVDLQPGGDVVVLFPNEFSRDNRIAAGTLYSIPSASDGFEISVTEPAGTDTVVAFFTEKKVAWLDPAKLEGSGFWTVKPVERLFASRALSVTATGMKKDEWESLVIDIEVGR